MDALQNLPMFLEILPHEMPGDRGGREVSDAFPG
jgi:hypothetical protein